MSQRSVERVIGRLVTDEGFRRRFTADPTSVLAELAAAGIDLNPCERHALATLDFAAVCRCADAIDPRLQKSDLSGGAS